MDSKAIYSLNLLLTYALALRIIYIVYIWNSI
jgi:hypothetical protein